MSPVVRASLQLLLLLALACGPSDPMPEVRKLQDAGDFEQTIGLLRQIVREDPSHTEASLLLGKALLRTGNAGLAVWPLRKAAEFPDYAVEAGMLMTRAILASGTSLDAVEEIEKVLEIEPNNLNASALLADAHRSTREIEVSLANIERVLELHPTNLAVLVTRVTALIALHRIEEAGASLDAAQASFDAFENDIASRMLARLCVARASFTAERGEMEKAEKHYADCAKQFPTEAAAVTEIVAFYDRIQKSERATEVLERASIELSTDPFRTTLTRRMDALGILGTKEQLLLERAETQHSTEAWFAVADDYVQRGRFDKAIDAFENALSLSPGSPRLSFAYADTLVQAEQFEKAREVANQLEQPKFQSLILGRIFLAEGNSRDALAAFETGIELWPENAVGRFLAGQAAEGVGEFKQAISHYRESFRASPGSSAAGLALAKLYASQGSLKGALQVSGKYLQTPAHYQDPEALLVNIRSAHALALSKLVDKKLARLSKIPGQAAVAVAERASIWAKAGATEQAVGVVEAAGLDLTDSANSIAFRVLIEQLEMLGQHKKIMGPIEVALAAYPDDSIFHELHGRALYAAAQPDQARASYKRALELDAANWRALEGLAVLATAAGDTPRALNLYDRALAADPEDAMTAFAAVALVRETDPDEAAQRLERLLDAHPHAATAANDLAGILADRGELERASIYAARAAWFHLPEAAKTLERIEQLRAGAATAMEPQ